MTGVAVTVVIPTYNWSTVLRCAIKSVLDQTFVDFELLVVGDGCTDDTAEVVNRASEVDGRVRWIGLADNAGTQAVPNNAGLAAATGAVVAYLGHDDLWLPRHLATVVDALAANPDSVVVHTRSCLVVPGQAPAMHPPADYQFCAGDWLAPTATAHRREPALAIGGWRRPDESGTRDPEADLWARLADAHGPGLISPHITALKLPAAIRRGVYKTRPAGEQHRWLDEIGRSADPEAMLRDLITSGEPTAGHTDEPPAIFSDPEADAAERHRVRRQWKGLD